MMFHRAFPLFLKVKSVGIRNFTSNTGYQLLYSLSYARVGAAINGMKVKQSLLTGLAVPVSAALEFQSIIGPNITPICIIFFISSNVVFYGVGQLFYKLVGKVYLDEDRKLVKLAYVGYFGKRMEVEVPLEDIIPPGDEKPGFLYSKLRFENSALVLKFNEKYYDYCDFRLARKVFGESFQRL